MHIILSLDRWVTCCFLVHLKFLAPPRMKAVLAISLRYLLMVALLIQLYALYTGRYPFLLEHHYFPFAPDRSVIAFGLLTLSSCCLLHKNTTWLGAMIATHVIAINYVLFHIYNTNELKEVNSSNQYFSGLIWCLSLFVLWNERKNIPFIN